MLLVHKVRLNPNNKQRGYFERASGTARFAYNWALAEWQRQYEAGEKPAEAALRKQLNSIKREQYSVNGKKIKLPKVGWINMAESVRFTGQIKSVTVSKIAGRWFAAILVDADALPHNRKNHAVVGVDLGVKALAVMSDGTVVEGAKSHCKNLKKLRYLNKELSRRKRGSKVVIYPRFRPSSKLCSACGSIQDMPLSKRAFICDCGNRIDRDLNAAINIKNYAVSTTACGDDSSGLLP